ncbi:MAG TPA: deoxyribonuclease IV [Candidatus Polarisedimenticolaceae bacterium]|nr:deoxyribonuclease IV [Candidatus Polarisedimenticolaceae bacterium]
MSAPRLGAHMSVAGGMARAVEHALAVEATALQVFVKTPNQWAARPFGPTEAADYRRAAGGAGLAEHTLAHASYLINLGTPDATLWEKSIASFEDELARCDALGIPWLVVHPGSHVGSGTSAGCARVALALRRILGGRTGGAGVLLENTAGQGNTLGARPEELAEILRGAGDDDRLGVCFDTCHALASGFDLRAKDGYERTMDAFGTTVGLGRIRGIHLNDSQGDLGSRRDRHEHIGQGKIGLEGFRLILNDPRFASVPMVLETPKDDDLAEDRMNLGVLRSLVGR